MLTICKREREFCPKTGQPLFSDGSYQIKPGRGVSLFTMCCFLSVALITGDVMEVNVIDDSDTDEDDIG